MKRTRVCNNPSPQFGGADCYGTPTDTRNCGQGPCPGDTLTLFLNRSEGNTRNISLGAVIKA